jgi:hypothetical protein
MRRRPDILILRLLALACLIGSGCGVALAQQVATAATVDAPLFEPSADDEASVLASPAADTELDASAEPEADNGADVLRAEVRRTHPWARFEPGAWRRLRVVTESFDAAGESSGVNASERIERLVAVDDETYTLEVENLAPLAGLPTPGAVESRHLSLLTDRSADLGTLTIEEAEPANISFGGSLGGIVVPCRTWRATTTGEGATEEEVLSVAVGSDPAVLRRTLTTTLGGAPGVGGARGATVTANVSRLDLPALYAERLTRSWHLATTITHPSGSRTERAAVYSADAPGGLHSESAADFDASGRRTFWSVTDLVESGRTPVERVAAAEAPETPAVSVEVHSRRLMRLLRRDERRTDDPAAPAPVPMQ